MTNVYNHVLQKHRAFFRNINFMKSCDLLWETDVFMFFQIQTIQIFVIVCNNTLFLASAFEAKRLMPLSKRQNVKNT